MDIQKTVIEVMEEVLGLPQDELIDNLDLNLKEEGLIDSVSCASIITMVEDNLDVEMDYDKINIKDLTSINYMVKAFAGAIK